MKPDVSPLTVCQVVALDFLGEAGHEGRLDAELRYDGCDPYAMSLVFDTAPPVVWTFARDLLLRGMYEPVGDGDVQVWPGLRRDGVATVMIELSSPDGQVTVETELRTAHAFAKRMLAAVPLGHEADHIDLDATLESLLGSSPDFSL